MTYAYKTNQKARVTSRVSKQPSLPGMPCDDNPGVWFTVYSFVRLLIQDSYIHQGPVVLQSVAVASGEATGRIPHLDQWRFYLC